MQQASNTHNNVVGTTDYPTHSRKILAVSDQHAEQSRMPEHVVVGTSSMPRPHRGRGQTPEYVLERAGTMPRLQKVDSQQTAVHTAAQRRPALRAHVYEQIEMDPKPAELESLQASVKRNQRWSPKPGRDYQGVKEVESGSRRHVTDRTSDTDSRTSRHSMAAGSVDTLQQEPGEVSRG